MKKWGFWLLCVLPLGLMGQTTRGKEFWLNFLPNLGADSGFIFISTDQKVTSAKVKVSIPTFGFNDSFVMGKNELKRVFIPNSYKPNIGDTLGHFKSIWVKSDQDVSVYVLSVANYTTDASCVFPISSIPEEPEFFIADADPIYNVNKPLFSVLAIEDSTVVEITPRNNTFNNLVGGVTYTYRMKRGEVRMFVSNATLTGSKIKVISKGKKVVVFAGDHCSNIRCTACDHLIEVVSPTTVLGKRFVITPFYQQSKGYDYKVVATMPNTIISRNGLAVDTLSKAGDYFKEAFQFDSALCIEADNPVMVMQFMTGISCNSPKGGDPAMLLVNPLEQVIDEALVSTANSPVIQEHYINIVIPKTGLAQCYLDDSLIDQSKFTQIFCGDYYMYIQQVSPGNHRIVNKAGFIAYMYGIGRAESYAYSAGASLRNLKRYAKYEFLPSCDSGYLVKFTSYGDSATRFVWTFEDGKVDTSKSPIKYFSKLGNVNIKLKYFLFENKKWDSTLLSINLISREVQDYITFDSLVVCEPSYTFNLPPTQLYQYLWNTGDTTSSLKVTQSGKYKVRIKNPSSGCERFDSAYVRLENKVYTGFEHQMKIACPKEPLFLNDTSKVVGDSIIKRSWYVDYFFKAGKKRDTIFSTRANNYDIKLVIETKRGCKDSVQKRILVSDIPTAVVKLAVKDSCQNRNEFIGRNQSYLFVGKISRYTWLYSDGDTANGVTGYKTFAPKDTGNQWMRLIAWSETGCKDTSPFVRFKVYPAPKSQFGVMDSSVCLAGNYFEFKNGSLDQRSSKSYTWDFGDGTGNTFDEPGKKSYSDTGDYRVRFIAGFIKTGCKDTSYRTVSIGLSPKAVFLVDSLDFCVNRNFVQATSASIANSKNKLSHTWRWGDSTQTLDSISYKKVFAYPGTKRMTLLVSTGKGCVDSVRKNVIIYNAPQAQFIFTDSQICGVNHFFDLSNLTKGPVNTRYVWDFGDGRNDTRKNPPRLQYSMLDKYQVVLKATDPLTTCVDTFSKWVNILTFPNLMIGNLPSEVCDTNQLLKLEDLTVYGKDYNQRRWVYEGKEDTQKVFVFNPSKKGAQSVILIGGKEGVCADTNTYYFNVKTEKFTLSNTLLNYQHCAPALYQWAAIVNTYGDFSFDWNFPSLGMNYTDSMVQIKSAWAGKHPFSIIASDLTGCKDTLQDTLDIYAKPEVWIERIGDSLQCLKGNNYQFNAQYNSGNPPMLFNWNLGEAQVSLLSNPNINYVNTGTKNIQLILTDERGCKDTAGTEVQVKAHPLAVWSLDSGCFGKKLVFRSNAIANDKGRSSYRWYINNELKSTDSIYSTQSLPTGKHQISLVVGNVSGCTDTLGEATIEVFPKPVANFGFEFGKPDAAGVPAYFTDSSIGVSSWKWIPENGKWFTEKNLQYRYKIMGKQEVTLIVESAKGCLDTARKEVFVRSDEYGWLPTSFTPNGDGLNDVFGVTDLSPVSSYSLMIFNRWGQKIFDSNDGTATWDGTYMGKPVQQDTYMYQINLVYITGKRKVENGNVTLLR